MRARPNSFSILSIVPQQFTMDVDRDLLLRINAIKPAKPLKWRLGEFMPQDI
jgi:hypothetical protein